MAADVEIDAAASAAASDMIKGSTLHARRRKAVRNCTLVATSCIKEIFSAG
jgi:hypothetical protein